MKTKQEQIIVTNKQQHKNHTISNLNILKQVCSSFKLNENKTERCCCNKKTTTQKIIIFKPQNFKTAFFIIQIK